MTWDRIPCVHRNGDITGYSIQHGATAFDNMATVTGTTDEMRTFEASGLEPLTTYMFRVAAVNSNGTGPYSATELFQSKQSMHVHVMGLLVCLFVIQPPLISKKLSVNDGKQGSLHCMEAQASPPPPQPPYIYPTIILIPPSFHTLAT